MDKNDLEQYLAESIATEASTVHLLADRVPCMRVNGELVQASDTSVSAQDLEDLTHDLLFADHRARLQTLGEVEVLYTARSGARFRVSVMLQASGLSLLFRRLPTETPSFDELSLPDLFTCFTTFQSGIVVVTGFFGSGKTTTLTALIERLNRESSSHVVTVEDPIEVIYSPGEALIHQREVGSHVQSFSEGVRQAARLGADIIVVSELNDYESLVAMLEAAERGCLVLTTFDASSVVGACTDIIALCPPDERARMRVRFAHGLRAMVTQMLLQRSEESGRVPLFEVLINNQTVTRAMRAGNFHELPSIMRRSRGLGMQTSDSGLRNLLVRKLISREEALYHAIDPEFVASGPSLQAPLVKQ